MVIKRVPVLDKFEWQKSVKDKDLSTPPTSPSVGDRYIIASSATGDWSGHDDEIAQWNGNSWDFTEPFKGMFIFVEDENALYCYITSWEEFTSGSGDMLKSTYDTDDDGIVDKAESVDDGTNSATAADISSAVSKAHDQNTDTILKGASGELIDQQQPNAIGNDVKVGDGEDLAQTFTAGKTGDLTKVKFYAYRYTYDNDRDLIVEVRTVDEDGKPTITVLASETISYSNFPKNTWVHYTLTFSDPASVTSGTKYALVFRTSQSDGYYFLKDDGNNNSYPNGEYLYSEYGQEDWTTWNNYDIYFVTYVTVESADLINNGILKSNLSVDSGVTIDGRDISVDGAKLDTIEENAVALDTVKSDTDISDAISKKHSQNTDTYLDQGGANQVSASELRTALDTTIPSKADKVSGATANNLASLDANGNLQDSGIAKDNVILKDGSVAFTNPVSGVTPTANAHLATKGYVDSVAQGLEWQESVLDKDLSTPPASPSTGDRYIVGSSPTGDWSGHANDVAEWNGSSWDFVASEEGFACWVEDEDALYVFNGTSWVQFGSTIDHGTLQGLSDDDHPQYLNTTRGDARYYTQTQLDSGQLDNRYYTETEVDNLLNNKADKVSGATSGNLASLDANGNLQDAGIASSNVFDKSADDLDDISDGSTYGRVKLSELTSGQVNRLNDGSNTVTAAQGKKAYDTRAQYDASTDEIVFVDPDTYSG